MTHIERTPVDVALARRQHQSYVTAVAGCGWRTVPVAPADDCPDSVFIEDTVVICGDLVVVTRPGAPERRPETAAVEAVVGDLGLAMTRIEEPGTLDGGDVLQIDSNRLRGTPLGGTNAREGIRQLRRALAGTG